MSANRCVSALESFELVGNGVIMGLYERDYMRGPTSSGKTSQIIVTLSIIASLVVASSYLLKEYRLFSNSHPKPAIVEPSRHEKLLKISPIDLNTAAYADLRLLPHVSERMATEIMGQRPLYTIDQLDDVYGIGEKKLAAIRPHVYVDQETLSQRFPNDSKGENSELVGSD